ncbi:hypothetical protein BDV98DRAFT_564618 [Pterulicium gracile]|uniref:Acyl-CoA desaturase n=1 Tax=Pterulicium gracile TaxID=1884261 RepID=A0A5C3QTT1_9AGAR|nr:hypothetical protein BDV98DRAFT_564618 [Pterula gracilis]
MTVTTFDAKDASTPKIWWSNAFFFTGIHVAAVAGAYYLPPTSVAWQSLVLAFLVWQLADFGITIGYHRLYSHRAFRASFGVRLALALLGSAGFQGSIKWWCLRHRLHHRFTDDVVHDPYPATRGLLYSHVGWIFYKPMYRKLELVDKDDLESDPVVVFQHKYYVPLALSLGFGFPALMGMLWKDPVGSFIWGGLVSRLAIWHCTFLVNSLAHWDGLQPYSDENTSRGNLILALLTGGEGNHNFHAFPHDYRSGPSYIDWDPSKWIIAALHRLGLVNGLRRAREADMQEALEYMRSNAHPHHHHHHSGDSDDDLDLAEGLKPDWQDQVWGLQEAEAYKVTHPGCCLIVVDDCVVDATKYLGDHPGGSALLRRYSIRPATSTGENTSWRDATWAFRGGLNQHTRAARKQMREMRIARWKE